MQSWSLPSEVKGYELIAELACGGMATVYAARRVAAAGFERLVVIKRLHPHLTADEEARALFRDEARFGAMLRHPNVVPVIDVIEAGDEILLVQPYVESVTLAQLLRAASRSGDRPPPAVGLRVVCDVLSGLHEAHEAKDLKGESLHLVHRDLSPQNILVAVDGSSRLIDFGVSKPAGAVDPEEVALRGKFPYLSPEQVNGLSLDRRAGLFAAGSLLFEVLTGRRLFGGGDPADTMMKVVAAELPAPSSVVDALPVALDAVVARALERDRAERFQTAVEMMDAIEAAVAPATHREVGLWVQDLLGDLLAERREHLQDAFALNEGDGAASADAAGQVTAGSAPSDSPRVPFSSGRFRVRRSFAIAALVLAATVLLAAIGYAGMRNTAKPVSTSKAPAGPAIEAVASPDEQAREQKPALQEPSDAIVAKTVEAGERLTSERRFPSAPRDVTPAASQVSNPSTALRRPEPRRNLSRTRLHDLSSIAPAGSSESTGEQPGAGDSGPPTDPGKESGTDDNALSDGPALHDNPYAP